ncbi:hypothetical protein [Proteocatella sphenisci]|nr:hypothetical protein [Proteocatella sphenisci]
MSYDPDLSSEYETVVDDYDSVEDMCNDLGLNLDEVYDDEDED